MSFTLELSGFKSKEDVEVFLDWYGGQGEQDIVYWWEEWSKNPDNSPTLKYPQDMTIHDGNVIKASVKQ
jgi:hypothetical protein